MRHSENVPAPLTKEQVIERFCELSDKVATKLYNNTEPADCFCRGEKFNTVGSFQFSASVMNFICEVVENHLPD
jgi:hypothetical protein